MITIKTFTDNMFGENAYVVARNVPGVCWVIDPGLPDGTAALLEYLRADQLTVIAIVNTHAHADHIAGIDAVKERFPEAELYLAHEEKAALTDPGENLSSPSRNAFPGQSKSRSRSPARGDVDPRRYVLEGLRYVRPLSRRPEFLLRASRRGVFPGTPYLKEVSDVRISTTATIKTSSPTSRTISSPSPRTRWFIPATAAPPPSAGSESGILSWPIALRDHLVRSGGSFNFPIKIGNGGCIVPLGCRAKPWSAS